MSSTLRIRTNTNVSSSSLFPDDPNKYHDNDPESINTDSEKEPPSPFTSHTPTTRSTTPPAPAPGQPGWTTVTKTDWITSNPHPPNIATRRRSSIARYHRTLITYPDLPEWYDGNEYIPTGYRPPSHSFNLSLRSLLYMHNETINIYTHLIPALVFLYLLLSGKLLTHLRDKYSEDVTNSDEAVSTFFLFSVVVCLTLSASYHIFTNHSERMDVFWLRMDFVGIVLLTVGDFVSGIYMIFWCEVGERILYWVMIISLGVVDIVVLLSNRFQGRRWRRFRVLCFVGTGLSGFAPLAHGIYIFGLGQMMNISGVPYYLLEGGLLALGALVYTTRFPECLWPGKFDIYGSSHQIFHVLVVLATITHLVGILHAYDYNYHHRSCSLQHTH